MSMFRNILMSRQPGKTYVPGLVAAWKTYGKRNDDADRDVLYDYSGNGRDIKLYNFAFSGMSGYGGYGTSKWNRYGSTLIEAGKITQVDSNTVHMSAQGLYGGVHLGSLKEGDNFKIKYKISGVADNTYHLSLYVNSPDGVYIIRQNITDGEYEDTISAENYKTHYGVEEIPAPNQIFLVFRNNSSVDGQDVTLQQLPLYPGALVSDGVDDYGQCIKGFALPDDYTVVAIRKIFNTASDSALASKSRTAGQGAFIFDINRGGYSYGNPCSGPYNAPLFSYQTKTSYNGVVISPGSGMDTEDDTLCLFKKGVNRGDYLPAALYDLRIYDHSLTAEELQTVKDEMMSDYENATGGGIADITYVADWDAKGRSNDEEETMRSQWIDKATGRVINLSNYSFSEMSGWGGFRFDWSTGWSTDYQSLMTYVEKGKTKAVFSGFEDISASGITVLYNQSANIPSGTTIRIKGTGFLPGENWYCIDYASGSRYNYYGNGVLEFTTAVDIGYLRISIIMDNKTDRTITLEQLPVYPGALVGDGVDDSGQTAEAISDEVGTILAMYWKVADITGRWHYCFNCGHVENQTTRIYVGTSSVDSYGVNFGFTPTNWPLTQKMQISSACREPQSPADNLFVMAQSAAGAYDSIALSRLILIREKLDAAQQEFLKWKVGKEYRDWCKGNGYESAMEEMLNN